MEPFGRLTAAQFLTYGLILIRWLEGIQAVELVLKVSLGTLDHLDLKEKEDHQVNTLT